MEVGVECIDLCQCSIVTDDALHIAAPILTPDKIS